MPQSAERFEWLEIPRPQSAPAGKRVRAEDLSTKKCPRCGWLDPVAQEECFRCGYDYRSGNYAEDALHSEGLELPEVEFRVDKGFEQVINDRAKAGLSDWLLRTRAEELSLVRGFDELISLNDVDIEQYKYQLETARQSLDRMRGQVLLADEVGLGKTVEAGVIIKELVLRGLARRILVLTPASLVTQWQEELALKFGERFQVARRPEQFEESRVIASLDTAKSKRNAEVILQRTWDVLVVDEAHHLKNRRTKAFKFVNKIRKRYALFLTATPLHNELAELYSLITIIKPGLLGTIRGFNRHYVDEEDPRKPKNASHLKKMLSGVMIRNRRSSVGIELPPRRAAVYHLDLTDVERELYEGVTSYVRSEFKKQRSKGERDLSLVTLQKEICSSPQAAQKTLRKLASRQEVSRSVKRALLGFAKMCSAVPVPRKTEACREIVERFPGRMIVYTDFLGSLRHLSTSLRKVRRDVLEFHGGLPMQQRRRIVQAFREMPDAVLVSTQAGGEGLNFQFCNQVLNYDLPWNPMRVEQRIGRVHRIGQAREVNVFNLAVNGTIEERIIELLSLKIRMFEMIIGELDLILGAMDLSKPFEQLVAEIWLTSGSDGEAKERFDDLGDRIVTARKQYERVKEAEQVLSDLADI